VPPAELEAVLCTHPAVADAGVIGISDADGGEVPRAYVALKHGATATPAELKQFVAGCAMNFHEQFVQSFQCFDSSAWVTEKASCL